MEQIVDRHDQADDLGRSQHLLREGGAFYDSYRHWLTATPGAELAPGGGIVTERGTPSSRTSSATA